MTTDTIKLELIQWLTGLQDKSVLTSLLQFKKSEESGDWYDNLTTDQLESLERGLEDIKNGRLISNEDFWSSYGRTGILQ